MEYFTDGKRHIVCIPYSIENLHKMADDLGISRSWYHSGDKPHYDIPKKRIAEIEARCTLVRSRTIVAITKGENIYVKNSDTQK
jgi:hypothetical protein